MFLTNSLSRIRRGTRYCHRRRVRTPQSGTPVRRKVCPYPILGTTRLYRVKINYVRRPFQGEMGRSVHDGATDGRRKTPYGRKVLELFIKFARGGIPVLQAHGMR